MNNKTKSITPRDTQSFKLYLREVSRIKPFTDAEEKAVTLRMEKGDEKALDELVLHNLRFVISVAKQYQGRGLDLEDLVNEGNIGLIQAAHKFDRSRNIKFISYAVWWVRQSISQALYKGSKSIRLPMSQYIVLNKYYKFTQDFEQKNQRQPTPEEIEENVGVSYAKISDLLVLCNTYMSFDVPLVDDETNNTLEDVVSNNEPTVEDEIIKNELSCELDRIFSHLKFRDAVILKMHFGIGLNNPVKTKDIADMFCLSNSRILQIIESSLEILKSKYSKELQELL